MEGGGVGEGGVSFDSFGDVVLRSRCVQLQTHTHKNTLGQFPRPHRPHQPDPNQLQPTHPPLYYSDSVAMATLLRRCCPPTVSVFNHQNVPGRSSGGSASAGKPTSSPASCCLLL